MVETQAKMPRESKADEVGGQQHCKAQVGEATSLEQQTSARRSDPIFKGVVIDAMGSSSRVGIV